MLLICYSVVKQLKKNYIIVPIEKLDEYDNYYYFFENNGFGLVDIHFTITIDNNITWWFE